MKLINIYFKGILSVYFTIYSMIFSRPVRESQHMITDETIVSENNFDMESKQRSHNFNSSIEDITNNNNNNSLAASLQGPLTSTKKIPDGEIIITNMDSLNNNHGDTPRNVKPSNEHVRVSKIVFNVFIIYLSFVLNQVVP